MRDRIFRLLTRKTSGGRFIPEIDGLRFIAIFTVALMHSINHYYNKLGPVDFQNFEFANNIIEIIQSNFNRGVELFFAISGFILALPFAKAHLLNKPKPELKKYFLRRLTRLEPPYVLTLILFFALNYFSHHNSFQELFSHFMASLFYVHNFIYPGTLPLINGVAWSLEIEVQFYILAPLLTYLFVIRNKWNRRAVILMIITLFSLLNFILEFETRSILGFMQYFMVGFLIADIYLDKDKLNFLNEQKFIGFIVGCVSLVCIFIVNESLEELILPLGIFLLFYACLFTPIWRRLASLKMFTVIGGMCYTIYLIHVYIIAIMDKILVNVMGTHTSIPNFILHIVLVLFSILIISIIFFLLIEKPCMDKDWVKKLRTRLRVSS